jgi:hypothetical protein
MKRPISTTGHVANASHHPEGNVNAEAFDERDARLILLLTAALSEYVERRRLIAALGEA